MLLAELGFLSMRGQIFRELLDGHHSFAPCKISLNNSCAGLADKDEEEEFGEGYGSIFINIGNSHYLLNLIIKCPEVAAHVVSLLVVVRGHRIEEICVGHFEVAIFVFEGGELLKDLLGFPKEPNLIFLISLPHFLIHAAVLRYHLVMSLFSKIFSSCTLLFKRLSILKIRTVKSFALWRALIKRKCCCRKRRQHQVGVIES